MAKKQSNPQPRIFIGSSSESRTIVNAFAKQLGSAAQVEKWWESASFRPTVSTLASLQFAAREHDFGLFVFARDDVVESRGRASKAPRDNVIFELGLFLGTLGPERTFATVVQGKKKNQKVKVPSDLAGINLPTVNAGTKAELDQGIKETSAQFRQIVNQLGFFNNRLPVMREYDYDSKACEFEMVLDGAELQKWREVLQDRNFFAVTMVHDKYVHFYDDTRIAVGAAREMSPFGGDLHLKADASGVITPKKGQLILGCLMVIPKSVRKRSFSCVREMMSYGAQLIARVGVEE